MNLRQALVFAILMEGGIGIMTKAPDYLKEKLNSCESMEEPETLLDPVNLRKFRLWRERWHIEFEQKNSS